MHLDGARIFNAAAAQGAGGALAAPADSVTLLPLQGAVRPGGLGPLRAADFITERAGCASVGGGMRQAGVLAAAGIVALEADGRPAGRGPCTGARLAEELSQHPGDPARSWDPTDQHGLPEPGGGCPSDAAQITDRLWPMGMRVEPSGPRRFRLVLHYWVDDVGVERAVEAFRPRSAKPDASPAWLEHSRRRPGPQSGPPGAHLTPLAAFQNSTPTMLSSSRNSTVPPVCWKLQPGILFVSIEMSVPPCTSTYYAITIEGEIDASWSDRLGGMLLVSRKEADGIRLTTLSGAITDQAALRGLLNRLWYLNLVLRSVQQADPATLPSME